MAVKFTPQMLSKLKSDYGKVKMMSVVTPEYKRLKALIQSLPDSEKQKLIDADIKWLKNIAKMTMKEDSNTEITEEKFYVGYNKGRGQGKGVFKGVFPSYKEAKKEVDKLIKLFSGSHNMTAYYVVDKNGNPVLEAKEEGGSGEFSASQLKKLHEEYTTIDKKGITEEVLVNIGNTLSDIPNKGLEQLSEAGIPILSQMAKIVLNAK